MAYDFYAIDIPAEERGIYTEWENVQPKVDGRTNSYKGFNRRQDAVDWLKDDEAVASDRTKIFVDGGHMGRDGEDAYGWGFVVMKDGEITHTEYGGLLESEQRSQDLADQNNAASEMQAAMRATAWAAKHEDEGVVICYDHNGIEAWPRGDWDCNTEATKDYREFMRDAGKEGTIHTFEKVPGHEGIRGNERADDLATKGMEEAIDRAEEQEQEKVFA